MRICRLVDSDSSLGLHLTFSVLLCRCAASCKTTNKKLQQVGNSFTCHYAQLTKGGEKNTDNRPHMQFHGGEHVQRERLSGQTAECMRYLFLTKYTQQKYKRTNPKG